MIAEREIAGFVLPFTIGIIAATILSSPYFTYSIIPAIASVLLAVASVFHLIHPLHSRWGRHTIISLIIASALGCGLFVGFTHKLSSVCQAHDYSVIPDQIISLGGALKSSIEKIPFKNIATNHIISALLSGERSGISPETLSAFRESGASHILALSGLHLGIIYGISSKLLTILGHSANANRIRALITITICGIYTAATGAGASIIRALLFILVGETAKLCGRHRSLAQVLSVSLFIQLLLWPESIKDIGFQLSYAAVIGIAFIFPVLKRLWPEGRGGIMRWIWMSAAMSIACQITTAPLAYIYFGTFPQYFILTNLLALPLTGLIIPAGLLTIALHCLGVCPHIAIMFTESLVGLLTDVLNIIATM